MPTFTNQFHGRRPINRRTGKIAAPTQIFEKYRENVSVDGKIAKFHTTSRKTADFTERRPRHGLYVMARLTCHSIYVLMGT